jgi:5'-nucleotidase
MMRSVKPNNQQCKILLTNDDGVDSPGIWATAAELSELGAVTIAAPRTQQTGTGRGYFGFATDGSIHKEKRVHNELEFEVYSINSTPAQVVLQAIMEILPEKPDLVVSGINYGENFCIDLTSSGTVGAALEAASLGIPAIAISMETVDNMWFEYSDKVNFSVSAYFARVFAQILLNRSMPEDVSLLNINVPGNATRETQWRTTRLSPNHYYQRYIKRNGDFSSSASMDATIQISADEKEDTDIFAVKFDHMVSVTPLSMDLTARVDLRHLQNLLSQN